MKIIPIIVLLAGSFFLGNKFYDGVKLKREYQQQQKQHCLDMLQAIATGTAKQKRAVVSKILLYPNIMPQCESLGVLLENEEFEDEALRQKRQWELMRLPKEKNPDGGQG